MDDVTTTSYFFCPKFVVVIENHRTHIGPQEKRQKISILAYYR